MKRKIKVYLDTSVVSALFDDSNPERKSLTEAFFDQIGNFEAFISQITVVEIDRTPNTEVRRKMKDTISRFSALTLTVEVESIASEYIRQGAVPEGYPEDAYHIAVAATNDMDYLLSWNFKHVVRRKTRDIVRMVNTLNNLRQIEIMTPGELL